MDDTKVIMYILMRNDLASMTPGRACAQAAHAANHCVSVVYDMEELQEWEDETIQKFGTTIVLGVNDDQMNSIINKIYGHPYDGEQLLMTSIITDPEYGVKDGEVIHYISLQTCAWIFGRKKDVAPYVSHLNLY